MSEAQIRLMQSVRALTLEGVEAQVRAMRFDAWLSLSETADALGLSREQVRQIEVGLLRRARLTEQQGA